MTTPTTIQGFSYGSTNAKLIENNYTAGGVKIFASVGGTTMAEYTEYTATVPTWTKSYTYFGDTQLATITPNGSGSEYVEFNHPDRLGTRLMTNQAGGTAYEQTHLPFGTALNAESTGSTNNRFTSYDRSAPTGLDYAINRTYDSKLGRFTQVDPIRMGDSSLVNPQSFNLYSYCQNDPINHLDPSGLGFFSFLKKLLKWAMIAITVLVVVALIIIAAAIVAAVVFDVVLPSFLGGSGFLGALLGIFQSIGIGASSFAAGAFGIEISSSTGGAYALGLLFGVGAIANSFQNDDKKKKKKETKKQRRDRLIKSSVQSALWRLAKMPGCKEFIQEEFTKMDPAWTLDTLYKNGKIQPNNLPSSTSGALAQSPVGKGVFGTPTYLSDDWFDIKKMSPYIHANLSQTNLRTLVILHELKHRIGTPHDTAPDGTSRDDFYFNDGIAKHCFGVK